MIHLAQNMVKARSTQECEDSMNASGLFLSKCSLEGVPFGIAKQTAAAYFRLFRDFPFLAGRIDGVGTYSGSGLTYAHCHMNRENNAFDGGAVHLNLYHFTDAKELNKSYCGIEGSEEDRRFHPENTDYKAIISHELGHTLDGYLTGIELCGKKVNGERCSVSQKIRKDTLKALGMKADDIAEQVSGYARSASCEWFAECFAEYIHSLTPRRMSIECMYQLRKLIEANVG
jgi:hypothetical protein